MADTRTCNAAVDLIGRHAAAGRANKPAFIDATDMLMLYHTR